MICFFISKSLRIANINMDCMLIEQFKALKAASSSTFDIWLRFVTEQACKVEKLMIEIPLVNNYYYKHHNDTFIHQSSLIKHLPAHCYIRLPLLDDHKSLYDSDL